MESKRNRAPASAFRSSSHCRHAHSRQAQFSGRDRCRARRDLGHLLGSVQTRKSSERKLLPETRNSDHVLLLRLQQRKGVSMDAPLHTIHGLFAQLGLSSETGDIDEFIAAHRPLGKGVTLASAPFWTTSQGTFLAEQIVEDADWVGVVDELNERLSK